MFGKTIAGIGLAAVLAGASPAEGITYIMGIGGAWGNDGPHQGKTLEWRSAGEDLAGCEEESGTYREQKLKTRPLIGRPIICYGDTARSGILQRTPFGVEEGTCKTYPFQMKIYPIHTRDGDTLEHIAHVLSIIRQETVTWQDLYEENEETIGPDPNRIYPDMDLEYVSWEENPGYDAGLEKTDKPCTGNEDNKNSSVPSSWHQGLLFILR